MKFFFLCKYLSTGGAERVCVDIANGLVKRGHQVTILTDLNRQITYQPHPNIELVDCNMTRFRYLLRNFIQIFHLLRRESPDVVVSMLYVRSLSAKLASILTCHCPVVASDHNSFERPVGYHLKFIQRLDKFYFGYIYDYLTVLTNADLKCLNGRFKNKSCVMYNPLAFTPLDKVPKKEKVVLAVGRVVSWKVKGFDILLKAWKNVSANHNDWMLRIVGDGPEDVKNYLMNSADNPQNVEFYPYTTKIIEEYNKASIFVLSSRFEGFGLVLTEAMSQGCACVACDYKGRQSEIITDGKDGLTCETEDIGMLTQKLEFLITHDKEREEYQRNALKALGKYNIDKVVTEWEKLFTHLTKK